jgi:hypothetical protein
VAALLAVAPLAQAGAAIRSVPRRGRFVAARGSFVHLRGPSGRVRAKVTDVADLVGAPEGDPRRFSVILRPTRPLPDGLYRVSGRRLASTDLFLTNVDRGRAAALQAVVSTVPVRKLKARLNHPTARPPVPNR